MKKVALILLVVAMLAGLVYSATMPTYVPLGSYSADLAGPGRISLNARGWIYVTDALKQRITVLSGSGDKLYSINDVKRPLGIACGAQEKVYVGDGGTRNIRVYSKTGEFLYSMGDGTLGNPMDIEVSQSGLLYIVDDHEKSVHIYSASEEHMSSFGNSYLNKPVAIAIDEGASELYVADNRENKIFVFDMNGNYLRQIDGGGGWFSEGKLARPQGMYVDAERLYIADAYYGVVAVYDKTGNFVDYLSQFGKGDGEFRIPLDVDMDDENKMYVANYNNGRIEIFGIDDYIDWHVTPSVFNISLHENGSPVMQDITVSANKAINWSATKDVEWLSIDPLSGTTDSIVTMTINPSTISAGVYKGTVTVSTDTSERTVSVGLTVLPHYVMTVTPSSLNLTHQIGAPSIPSGSLNVNAEGSNFSWSSSTDEAWIQMDTVSGITPSVINITTDVTGKDIGTYNGSITVEAGSEVEGSPQTVTIVLDVIKAGNIFVTSNIENSSFTITGSETYSGSGLNWSVEDVPQGRYRIVFDHVKGYKRPAQKEFYVKSGQNVEIEGMYRSKEQRSAVTGIADGTGSNIVSAVDIFTNSQIAFFTASSTMLEDIIAGDFDNDGVDEIAVSDGENILRIFESDGSEVGNIAFSDDVSDISLGDIDGDGIDDIAVGLVSKKRKEITYVSLVKGQPVTSKTVLKSNGSEEFSLSTGDFNGDGNLDMAMKDADVVNLFDLSGKRPRKITTIPLLGNKVPRLSSGDMNDDGVHEIVISEENAEGINVVRILNADGSDYVQPVQGPYDDMGYLGISSVAAGDIDGDGEDEILVGAPEGDLVRIYESDGTFSGITVNGQTGTSGIKVSSGGF